jgi:hypothetical protein
MKYYNNAAITKFPEFSRLSLDHKKKITRIISAYEPYADFNFTNLYCWDTDDTAEIALLNKNLVIKYPDYITSETLYSIIGHTKIDESLTELFSHTNKLKLVPESVINKIKTKNKFNVNEDLDNFDYIYQVKDIATLAGAKYKKKRHKIHQAIDELSEGMVITNTMTLTPELQRKLLDLFDTWANETHESDESTQLERKALSRLLEASIKLNVIFTTIELNDIIVAFSIHELLKNKYALCHFEKAKSVHGNIYALVINKATSELLKHSVRYVNWEQDLGITGIRQAKMGYHPSKFLKKYTVTLADNG